MAKVVDCRGRKGAGKGAGADEEQQHLKQARKVEDRRLKGRRGEARGERRGGECKVRRSVH